MQLFVAKNDFLKTELGKACRTRLLSGIFLKELVGSATQMSKLLRNQTKHYLRADIYGFAFSVWATSRLPAPSPAWWTTTTMPLLTYRQLYILLTTLWILFQYKELFRTVKDEVCQSKQRIKEAPADASWEYLFQAVLVGLAGAIGWCLGTQVEDVLAVALQGE